ncbi:MAG: hypothetical protein PHP98_03710 [Kiritimatiellae bacterium]|nr:hypothetical protein [Kiritimatiellia bacterium]
MQAQQKAAHFVVQEKGGDYLFTLKGNQPTVQEKASALLSSAFPPSGSAAGADRGRLSFRNRRHGTSLLLPKIIGRSLPENGLVPPSGPARSGQSLPNLASVAL